MPKKSLESLLVKQIEEFRSKISELEKTMFTTMGSMNESLREHTKFSNLAHQRLDKHDEKLIVISHELNAVEDYHQELMPKINHVCEYVDNEIKEKEIRKKLEVETEKRRERKYKLIRHVATALGAILSAYATIQLFYSLIFN